MLPNLIQNHAAEHKNRGFQAKKTEQTVDLAREPGLSTQSEALYSQLSIVQTATPRTNQHPECSNRL